MKTTEASENTTWIGSVARGRSTRRVSSALVPSAMHAYWLPDAGSSATTRPRCRPAVDGPRARAAASARPSTRPPPRRARPPSTAVARILRSVPCTRLSSGGPNAVAELNSTFIGPNRVVAPRSAPTASGAANRPRPTTASWLVALPTPNSTTKRCPRCPRRTYGRMSTGAPLSRGRSSAAPTSSAGIPDTPHTATSRTAPAPCGCTASAGTATSSRTVSAASARCGRRSAEKQ